MSKKKLITKTTKETKTTKKKDTQALVLLDKILGLVSLKKNK